MQLPVSEITQIIIGLNDSMYGTVRSSIIQEKPLPKVKSIFARICKEEKHKNLAQTLMVEDGGNVSGIAFTATES